MLTKGNNKRNVTKIYIQETKKSGKIVEGLARSPAHKRLKSEYIIQNAKVGVLVYNIQTSKQTGLCSHMGRVVSWDLQFQC